MTINTYHITTHVKGGFLIDDGKSGTSLRYKTRDDAQRAIDRRVACEAYGVALRAQVRAKRLSVIHDYLSARAKRRAEDARQGLFDF